MFIIVLDLVVYISYPQAGGNHFYLMPWWVDLCLELSRVQVIVNVFFVVHFQNIPVIISPKHRCLSSGYTIGQVFKAPENVQQEPLLKTAFGMLDSGIFLIETVLWEFTCFVHFLKHSMILVRCTA